MRRALGPLLFCLALAPSAWLAWQARDAPHFGYFHDDSLYWVSAKSLAGGHGYRIESLPGEPHQTKYPPGYPLLLAAVWKFSPEFPRNLRAAVALSWLMLAGMLLAARATFVLLGAGKLEAWALTAVLALNPYYALSGISLLSGLPFTCLLLATILLLERTRSGGGAFAAGLAAAAAFLTRSAGLLLLIAGPLNLALRRERRRAALFAVAMLPAVAGWLIWTQTRHAEQSDQTTLFYTDYLGYWVRQVAAGSLGVVLWRNLDGLLSSIGGMFLFGLGDSLLAKSIARVVAVAALAGAIRLWRREAARTYVLFTAGYILTLLAWNFPPDQRFLTPVFPLLVAGLWTELLRLASKLRESWRRHALAERATAAAVSLALAALAFAVIAGAALGLFSALPRFLAEQRENLVAQRTAYHWIAAHTPPNAAFLAYQDPLLYLYTGRKSCRLVFPSALAYQPDPHALRRFFASAASVSHSQGLSYALLTPLDLFAELPGDKQREACEGLRANPGFELLHVSGDVTIWRVR
jgi:hypothetical protein